MTPAGASSLAGVSLRAVFMESIHKLIREAAERYPDEEPIEVARRVVKKMTAAQRSDYLAAELAWQVEAVRRDEVRRLEQEAIRSARDVAWAADEPFRLASAKASTEERAVRREERLERWRRYPWEAPKNHPIFREWSDTGAGREWHARHEAEKEAATERQHLFETDPAAYSERYGLMAVIRQFEQEVKVQFTAELLGASFALGDGRSVTWGDATLQDHRQRIDMLSAQVSGTAETIALHERAAALLRESGARCLNEARVAA